MRNSKIILVGYSGHGLVVAEALLLSGKIIVGYTELNEKKSNPLDLTYIGNEIEFIATPFFDKHSYIIGIGDNTKREVLTNELGTEGLINAIHPSALISQFTQLGLGVFISARVVLNANVSIGDGVICNTGAIIEHDCNLGKFCHIGPGCILGGGVNIGERTLIGLGARILPNVNIGNDVVIGAGSTVTKDLPDGTTAYTDIKFKIK
ncbi:MAG: acetyltransferase [Saprospiraceae bacterium]